MDENGKYVFGGCGAMFVVFVIVIAVLVLRKLRTVRRKDDESSQGN